MENGKDYRKLCNYIKWKGINTILNGEMNIDMLKSYSEEDILICMCLTAIKNEDFYIFNELNNKYFQKNNLIINAHHRNNIFFKIYERGLLDKEIVKTIISLENHNYNFDIFNDFMLSLYDKKDEKLFKLLYNNFIFDNSFIKAFLYCYKNSKNNKSINLPSNAVFQKIISKEMKKFDLNYIERPKWQNSIVNTCKREDNVNNNIDYLIENNIHVNTKISSSNKRHYESIIDILMEKGNYYTEDNHIALNRYKKMKMILY